MYLICIITNVPGASLFSDKFWINWLLIIKLNYYEPFAYFVGYALCILHKPRLFLLPLKSVLCFNSIELEPHSAISAKMGFPNFEQSLDYRGSI